MGWLGVIAFRPIADSLSSAELAWIVAGGLIYTAGVPFYVWKSRRYTHAVGTCSCSAAWPATLPRCSAW